MGKRMKSKLTKTGVIFSAFSILHSLINLFPLSSRLLQGVLDGRCDMIFVCDRIEYWKDITFSGKLIRLFEWVVQDKFVSFSELQTTVYD